MTYNDVDVDRVVEEMRRRAEDDDFIKHFFAKYGEETLRAFLASKIRGGTHRMAAINADMDASEGPLLGPEVEGMVLGRDQ